MLLHYMVPFRLIDVLAPATAFVASACVTPWVRSLAHATGYIDQPSSRKVHHHPKPLLGGVAVCVGVAAGVAVGILRFRIAGSPVDAGLGNLPVGRVLLAFALGLLIAFVLGLIDDRRGMHPGVKMIGQSLAALPLLLSGGALVVPGLPGVGFTLSLLWILTVMNAANFLDNMDGVLSGVGAIAALGLAVLAVWAGEPVVRLLSLALLGACAGFLLHNFPPASIFLGDAGSLVVGFSLASSSLLLARASQHWTGWVAPALVVGYLLFDITFVTIVRMSEGRKVYLGGTDHSSHRLRHILGSPRRAALGVYGLAGASVVIGLTARHVTPGPIALGVAGAAAVVFAILGGMLVRLAPTTIKPAPPPPSS